MLFLFLRLLFISCHFGLSVCEKNVTFLITKRQFISAKTRQMPGQEVRERRVPPHSNLYSDDTKTRGFYLLTRQVCEQHRAIVKSSAGAVKETRPGSRDTGEMAWSADVSALGKRSCFNLTVENTSKTGSQMDQIYREVSITSTKAYSVILQLHFYITGNALASLP